jgi:hypothetical protein
MSADPMSLHALEPNSLRSGRQMVKDVQEIVADMWQHIAILEIEYIREDCCLVSVI